ncbi:hypothetical protein BKP45_14530 [Anaerobacillus alkalidiazotrophicus]|uniref:Uncharacterized protein n=1 Tax=Anaerobacillus alkalidiazotrophicus TaxID=472963 RepID=A0A1S2M2G7_9BACI|nr:hypothetical protein [Anaerobacillus alkalidiazotrophicus]OIJ18942.1 hypothetical protein BKP45_14530 [Anaerobacillus alkalidiazotrophicus]
MIKNKWIWYGMVIICAIILTISFINNNPVMAIAAFSLALLLKKDYHNIPLPKRYNKFTRTENKTNQS